MGDNEDLLAMVDRMIISGGCGDEQVAKLALQMEKLLCVPSLEDDDYNTLAKQFMQLIVSKRNVNNSNGTRQGVDAMDLQDSNQDASPQVETAGIQSTYSTESTTSGDESNDQSCTNTNRNRPSSRGKSRSQDTDGIGASKPFRTRSPIRPPVAGLSPGKRVARSRSNSRSRVIRKPNSMAASDHSDSFKPFAPEVFAPPRVTRKEDNMFSKDVFSNNSGANHQMKADPPVAKVGQSLENVHISEPSAKAFGVASSPRRPEPPSQLGAESPRQPPSSPRPGLQEDDSGGIAQSPKTQWGPSSHSFRRRDDDGAGAVPTRTMPNRFTPRGEENNAKGTVSDPGDKKPSLFADSPPTGGPEDMQTTPVGHMFTPPTRMFTTGDRTIKKTAEEPNKTGLFKNRKKGGSPPIQQSFSFSPRNSESNTAPPNNASAPESSSNNANGFKPHTFVPSNLEQPTFNHNSAPLPNTIGGQPPMGSLFSFPDTNARQSRRAGRLRRGNNKHSSTNPLGKLNNATSRNMPGVAESTSISESDGMDIDPTTPSSTGSSNGSPGTKFVAQEISFQLGTVPRGNPKGRVFRRPQPSSTAPHLPKSGSFSQDLPNVGSFSQEAMDQKVMQPPPREDSPDYSELKTTISVIRNEARNSYINKDYTRSIKSYTYAIGELTKSPARFQLSDTLAVLHSNRAAALMMIGAFPVSSSDCEEGLHHVSNAGENGERFSGDSGPPLKVKLLTRCARALLKQGEYQEANEKFKEAINESQIALEYSKKVHGPEDQKQNKKLLEQMMIEATLGKSDAEQLRDLMGNVSKACQILASQDAVNRTAYVEALSHVKAAMAIAPGSISLFHIHMTLLSRMKRWRETALFCERVAADFTRMDGIFEGDLESKNPFSVFGNAVHLSPTFFGPNWEETSKTAELKLSSKAAAEAVFRLPNSMISTYLRALRLEERYPTAEACLAALEGFVRTGNSKTPPAQLQREFSWLHKERSKLDRTKIGREKGDEFFRKGDMELAAAQYGNCLNIDSEGEPNVDGLNAGGRLHAVLHCNRAACLIATCQYEPALEECTAALRIHRKYMKAILRRARCYHRLGRYKESISEYNNWLNSVEEARKNPDSLAFVTPCMFDGPKDVKKADIKSVEIELQSVKEAERKAEASKQETAKQRPERPYFSSGNIFGSATSGEPTAQQRREQYRDGRESSRHFDSFKRRGPRAQSRSQSSGPRARSNNFNAGSGRTGHRREKSADSPRQQNKSSTDYYEILGITRDASDSQVRKAYHKLAKTVHPDKNKDPHASAEFQKLNAAHEALRTEELRKKYNSEGNSKGSR